MKKEDLSLSLFEEINERNIKRLKNFLKQEMKNLYEIETAEGTIYRCYLILKNMYDNELIDSKCFADINLDTLFDEMTE